MIRGRRHLRIPPHIGKIAVITVGVPDLVVVFHVAKWGNVPKWFIDFMTSPWKKVGRGIVGDVKKIQRDLGFEIPLDQCEDLAALAKAKGILEHAGGRGSGLADLAAKVLQVFVPKPKGIRVSTLWERTPLPEDAKRYAADDCAIGVQLGIALKALPDVNIPVYQQKDKLVPGSLVDILERYGKKRRVIAQGRIVDVGPDPQVVAGTALTKTRCRVTVFPGCFIRNASLHYEIPQDGDRAGPKRCFGDLVLNDMIVVDSRHMRFTSKPLFTGEYSFISQQFRSGLIYLELSSACRPGQFWNQRVAYGSNTNCTNINNVRSDTGSITTGTGTVGTGTTSTGTSSVAVGADTCCVDTDSIGYHGTSCC